MMVVLFFVDGTSWPVPNPLYAFEFDTQVFTDYFSTRQDGNVFEQPCDDRQNRSFDCGYIDRAAQFVDYRVASASPSTSSATIRIGLPNLATCSRIGSKSPSN
jgi:hypothetical protein